MTVTKQVLAALYTGCRANELTSMLVSDFTASTNSLFVGNPKGRRTRHVLLPDEGTAFFSKLVGDRCGNERLFLKANRRTWGSEYKSYFQRARTKASLPNTLTFHGLRHTYASHLLQNGASILTVADQLGHANTQTVSSTYGHLTAKTRASDVDRCFSPLLDVEPNRPACNSNLLNDQSTDATLPMFHHREPSSWPRSNHSKFSGNLLVELRPSELDH